ncbi:SAM hydrolase/SAM-dependent halogenase family protein [Cesiribacter andamanensis]|uniref:S-adenosyl-l-methionine hydroxide adenosyltransferase n=1 Tax=Cesiribacter andamanensis AMV16 TaxID=1279009 RepID=M7NU59_9BACT|nr:SAM-dependent chlorinase/fluorinase [Cesiribacter andamanensis]EMR02029.1 S-adenosyl-l-methionine hydroxide adenosyltransferase [Cesiribacter andamanensis AMV16]
MAIITFMSDFGTTDHYVAAVKARILSTLPSQLIVDISHQIQHFNIAHGSFVLGNVFREFPPGTIHLIAVHATGGLGEPYIAIKLEGHYFIGTDNGLLGLISEQEPEEIVILGKTEAEKALARLTTFPARDLMAPAAALLAQGAPLSALGEPTPYFNRMLPRKPRLSRQLIAGHVIHIDHFGNLVTNVRKDEFEQLVSDKFLIKLGREQITKIHKTYNLVDAGDLFAVFNSLGLLEIGIHSGHAGELLGMEYDSAILVHIPATDEEAGALMGIRQRGIRRTL